MSEIEVVLTVISVIGALSTILFAYLAFKRANKKEDKLSGKNEGIIISDISYIKSSTERIEKRLDKLGHQYRYDYPSGRFRTGCQKPKQSQIC